MKHKKAVRNHPAADVAVGVISECVAVSTLIHYWRLDSFWGTFWSLWMVAGLAPWTWWAIAYLRNGPPPDPLSLYANDPEDDDTGEIFPAVLTADDLTINAEPFTIDAAGVEIRRGPDDRPTFSETLGLVVASWDGQLPVAKFTPIQGAIQQDKQKAIRDRLADDLHAAGGSYTGDPRLAPGFWKQEDDETDDDYWRRLCGHDRPGQRHLITCPDWTPA